MYLFCISCKKIVATIKVPALVVVLFNNFYYYYIIIIIIIIITTTTTVIIIIITIISSCSSTFNCNKNSNGEVTDSSVPLRRIFKLNILK